MRGRPDDEAVTDEAQLEADIAGFEFDPLGYVLYAFPWGEDGTELSDVKAPRKWQAGVFKTIGAKLKAMARFGAKVVKGTRRVAKAINDGLKAVPLQIARCSGHGIGKSAFIGMLTMWALSTHEDTKIVITANTEKQLQTKTSPELAKWHRLSINSHWFSYSATSLKSTDPEHAATWRADLIPWSEHNTEAFAGLHNKGKRIVLLMDESSAIADKVWEVAEGALTDADTQILWVALGNGTRNTGRFRECFRKFKHRWDYAQIDSRTVEGINLDQIEKWVEDYGEDHDFVKVRVRGMFPAAAARQFISEADVDAAYGRHLRPEQYSFAPVILSCEPAWTGDDELVIAKRQGLKAEILRTLPKNDNDLKIGSMLASLEDEHRADAVFVDGGFGTGIISYGRQTGRNWIIVWFGSTDVNDPGCLNKRAEMWKLMRDWLKEGGAIPPDPQLHADMIGPETVPDHKSGKLVLEPKEAMKARGIPSPNRADAIALTFAHPVATKKHASERGPFGRGQSQHEYNPLEVNA